MAGPHGQSAAPAADSRPLAFAVGGGCEVVCPLTGRHDDDEFTVTMVGLISGMPGRHQQGHRPTTRRRERARTGAISAGPAPSTTTPCTHRVRPWTVPINRVIGHLGGGLVHPRQRPVATAYAQDGHRRSRTPSTSRTPASTAPSLRGSRRGSGGRRRRMAPRLGPRWPVVSVPPRPRCRGPGRWPGPGWRVGRRGSRRRDRNERCRHRRRATRAAARAPCPRFRSAWSPAPSRR